MKTLTSKLRVVARSARFLVFILGAILSRCMAVTFSAKARSRRAAAEWLQWTAEGCRRILALEPRTFGPLPSRGLLVANHLSYLDIILLAALRPCVFVSKAEVRGWPIFGQCAALGSTIFVDRSRRAKVSAVGEQMRAALAEDLLIVLFPEGTSSGGQRVLPFRSSLLEPALELGCPVTAAAIGYSIEEGSVPEEICYWKDMTLLPHLLNVWSKPSIRASVRCGVPRPRGGDRKSLAVELHDEVAALHAVSARELGVSLPEPVEQPLPVAGRRLPAAAEAQGS
jgi:1-acyl-sn-glycerol-3-phosphate acyltransferase